MISNDSDFTLHGNRVVIGFTAAIQVFCAVVFGIDILYESHMEMLNGVRISLVEAVHLGVELFAVVLLFVGYVSAHRLLRQLRTSEKAQARLLGSLRGHFDEIITAQFIKWGLSKAECDIALLSLRGLKISEIALLRETKEGTIKAQLSAVYHKSGIGTRSELLAYFMDEFLDFGAASESRSSAGRARNNTPNTALLAAE